MRFGEGIGTEPAKGFTLKVLLQARPWDLQGLRDAALLSLASDTGRCVAGLVRVEVGNIGLEPDKTASLDIPTSNSDQEGQVRLPGFRATLCG